MGRETIALLLKLVKIHATNAKPGIAPLTVISIGEAASAKWRQNKAVAVSDTVKQLHG